jgi:hypothetical protein
MPEDEKPEVAVKNPGHRFQPGHPRYGGKKKRTAAQAREMAATLGIDPLEYMLTLLASDTMDEIEIDATTGKRKKVKVPVPQALKVDISKAIIGFFYPRLNAQSITGPSGGAVEVATLDITTLLSDPEAAKAAQALALKMAEQERLAAGFPDAPKALLPAPDPNVALEVDSHGHWK